MGNSRAMGTARPAQIQGWDQGDATLPPATCLWAPCKPKPIILTDSFTASLTLDQ